MFIEIRREAGRGGGGGGGVSIHHPPCCTTVGVRICVYVRVVRQGLDLPSLQTLTYFGSDIGDMGFVHIKQTRALV